MHHSIALLSLASLTTANVGVDWSFPSLASGKGLKDVSFGFNMAKAPHTAGFYFAQQYNFVGHSDVGYTGVQPRPDNSGGPLIHAVFSSFINGTTTSSPTCTQGADGGPGVSCALDFNGDYSHTYNCVIENTSGSTWRGTIVDASTGDSHVIGEYTLPMASAGIQGSQMGFVEYYPFNGDPGHQCSSLPATEISFFNPTSKTSGAGDGKLAKPQPYGDCGTESNFQEKDVTNGFNVKVGFAQ